MQDVGVDARLKGVLLLQLLETPEQLQEKHALQASVYADVLHKAGYERVTLKFVRVEVPDPSDPTQPQVVTYEL